VYFWTLRLTDMMQFPAYGLWFMVHGFVFREVFDHSLNSCRLGDHAISVQLGLLGEAWVTQLPRLRVQSSGFRVQGSGFRGRGSGVRVQISVFWFRV
jgi:hypothetical protein